MQKLLRFQFENSYKKKRDKEFLSMIGGTCFLFLFILIYFLTEKVLGNDRWALKYFLFLFHLIYKEKATNMWGPLIID